MKDLAFWNAGSHATQGPGKVMVALRRALRRVLRPIFLHQHELFQALFDRLYAAELGVEEVRRASLEHSKQLRALANRQDEVDEHLKATREQLETTLAFGWDHVALVRRLAVLEDQIAILTGSAPAAEEGDDYSSIPFPGLEKMGAKPDDPTTEAEAHAKVS